MAHMVNVTTLTHKQIIIDINFMCVCVMYNQAILLSLSMLLIKQDYESSSSEAALKDSGALS